MPQLFDSLTATQIASRIEALQPATQPLWGTMNGAQMLAHCCITFESYFGEKKVKRVLLGYLFGSIAKKKALGTDKPFSKGLPTAKEYKISQECNFEQEKTRLKNLVHRFSVLGPQVDPCPKHPFFGTLTAHEWARLAYKHLDHHLRQFGV
jgi:hypothetical protein